MSQKLIAYYRRSTSKQSLSHEAQREAVARHLPDGLKPIATYVETESGRNDDRPELRRALDHCRRSGATLIVAKLDRLARSAHFLLSILNSGVEVCFCDLPQVSGPQGRFLLTSMAAVAELEAGLISQRTKEALARAKASGTRLGNPRGAEVLAGHVQKGCAASARRRAQDAQERAEAWRGTLEPMLASGMSHTAIAATLNDRGESSVSGGKWTATGVRRIRERLAL